jgi:hypothetical protein
MRSEWDISAPEGSDLSALARLRQLGEDIRLRGKRAACVPDEKPIQHLQAVSRPSQAQAAEVRRRLRWGIGSG